MKSSIYEHVNLRSIRQKREFRHGNPGYDVRKIGTPVSNESLNLNGGPYFELRGFDDNGVEYFDSESGHGVWSIGQHIKTGKIIASLGSDLYGNPDYKCIWLR
jgi:hypothetical protein